MSVLPNFIEAAFKTQLEKCLKDINSLKDEMLGILGSFREDIKVLSSTMEVMVPTCITNNTDISDGVHEVGDRRVFSRRNDPKEADKTNKSKNGGVSSVKAKQAIQQASTQLLERKQAEVMNRVLELNKPLACGAIVRAGNKPGADHVSEKLGMEEDADSLGKWTTVSRKHGRKRGNILQANREGKIIFGELQDQDAAQGIKAAPKKAFAFVSRLDASTTSDQLENYLKPHFPEVVCRGIESRYPSGYKSFKVEVDLQNCDRVMQAGLWPYGILVKRFFHHRPKSQEVK